MCTYINTYIYIYTHTYGHGESDTCGAEPTHANAGEGKPKEGTADPAWDLGKVWRVDCKDNDDHNNKDNNKDIDDDMIKIIPSLSHFYDEEKETVEMMM